MIEEAPTLEATASRTRDERGRGGRPRRAGYRARSSFTFALASLIISAAVAGLAYTGSRSYLTSQRERGARDRAYFNGRVVLDQLRTREVTPADVLSSVQADGRSVSLIRVDGEWFSSSVAVGPDDIPADVMRSVEGGRAAWQRFRNRGHAVIAVVVPLPSVDAVYAEVLPLEELEQSLRAMAGSLGAATAVTTFAGAVLGFVLAGRLVRQLRRLGRRAEEMAVGDAGAFGSDVDAELAPLVSSLNRVLAKHAHRAEEHSRFASDVSHEVRAPLAALSAAVAVMQRRRDQLPDRTAAALDVLTDQVDRFLDLVLDLLEIARIDAGSISLEVEPTDPRVLAIASAHSIGLDALPVVVADEVPHVVLLDRRRVRQMLVNLLENAHAYAGGPTALTVDRVDDLLRFIVDDAGPGVPVDERDRIFGRFERGAHGTRGPAGTGLGLALVAEHAAAHGGSVSIGDAPSGGARFIVEVQLCEP